MSIINLLKREVYNMFDYKEEESHKPARKESSTKASINDEHQKNDWDFDVIKERDNPLRFPFPSMEQEHKLQMENEEKNRQNILPYNGNLIIPDEHITIIEYATNLNDTGTKLKSLYKYIDSCLEKKLIIWMSLLLL